MAAEVNKTACLVPPNSPVDSEEPIYFFFVEATNPNPEKGFCYDSLFILLLLEVEYISKKKIYTRKKNHEINYDIQRGNVARSCFG